MDDNMDMQFQDIMEFVAGEDRGEEPKEGPMIQFDDEQRLPARIKVIGVGGGGGNAVSTMVKAGIQSVEFIATNTDRQVLDLARVPVKVQIGAGLTRGRGTLQNTLPFDVSITFPGQDDVLANGAPVQPQFSGTTLTSLTNVAPANGGSMTYSFVANHPGTFLYQSGTNPAIQVRMGLFGVLVVHPSINDEMNGLMYANSRLDSQYNPAAEYLVLFSEIDPYLNQAVELGNPINLKYYTPRYWLINGRGFPDTIAPNYASWLPTQPYGALARIRPFGMEERFACLADPEAESVESAACDIHRAYVELSLRRAAQEPAGAERAAEDAARQDLDAVLLDGLEETRADLGAVGDLAQAHAPQLAFSSEGLAERCHVFFRGLTARLGPDSCDSTECS